MPIFSRRGQSPCGSPTHPGRITIRGRDATKAIVQGNLELASGRTPPQWLKLDPTTFEATVEALPTREDVSIQINEQLIVEFCSR